MIERTTDQYPYFLAVAIPLFMADTTEATLMQVNDLYTWGYRSVHQQLMVYDGVPYLVVTLERLPEGRRAAQAAQPTNDAVLPPAPQPFDRSAGLAVPPYNISSEGE